MKAKTLLGSVLLLALVLSLAAGAGSVRVGAAALSPTGAVSQDAGQAIATVTVTPGSITWQPLVGTAGATLSVLAPDGTAWQQEFGAGETPEFVVAGAPRPDGSYSYQLTFRPRLSAEAQAALAAGADTAEREKVTAELQRTGQLPAGPLDLSGHFFIAQGAITVDAGAEPGAPKGGQPEDYVVSDDLIVTGSECLGFDCLTDGSENFGFDTLKLKENNLQIYFDDTSATPGFPFNDWRIIANDSTSGGANYLKIQDSTNSKEPFKIMAGAPTNSIYVSSTGLVGLGTSVPGRDVHIASGDTPTVRLDQDESGGYTAQTWDVAGNEASFFVRDVTAGSTQPFRIQPGTPTNTLTLKNTGNVGIGTWSPDISYRLQVANTGEDARLAVTRTDGATALLTATDSAALIGSAGTHPLEFVVNGLHAATVDQFGDLSLWEYGEFSAFGVIADFVKTSDFYSETGIQFRIGPQTVVQLDAAGNMNVHGALAASGVGSLGNQPLQLQVNGATKAVLDGSGNLTIEGALTEASDVNRKEGFCAVDQGSVLARIAGLPLFTWSYKGESARHMGPTAQDFSAAFGLGSDDRHIAPLDANGVALAGIQELYRQLQAEQAETARLSAENEDLRQRLDSLEALVQALLATQAGK
jgi:hypothetical protein